MVLWKTFLVAMQSVYIKELQHTRFPCSTHTYTCRVLIRFTAYVFFFIVWVSMCVCLNYNETSKAEIVDDGEKKNAM
jgi:hypothetical protein